MNPYQAPPPPQGPTHGEAWSRTPFILAGVGAFAAGGYWALLTLILGAAMSRGTANIKATSVVLPIILIVLYAYRGVLVIKGDARSAKSLLWLHGVGGLFAALALASSVGMFAAFLQGLKVAIHIFGGITAYVATKQAPPDPSSTY